METNTLEREAMKFILNGRSFDVASAFPVAVHRGAYTPDGYSDEYRGAEQVRFEDTLYRTQKGAFFAHEHNTAKYPKGKPVVADIAQELTAQEAVAWIATRGAVIIDPTGLDLPEEA